MIIIYLFKDTFLLNPNIKIIKMDRRNLITL